MMINNVAFCHNSNVKINNSPVLSQSQMIAHLRSRSSESEYLASCEQLSTGPFSICNTYNVSSFAILHPGNDDVCIKQMLRGVTGGDEDGDDDCDDDGDDDDDDDDGDADADACENCAQVLTEPKLVNWRHRSAIRSGGGELVGN